MMIATGLPPEFAQYRLAMIVSVSPGDLKSVLFLFGKRQGRKTVKKETNSSNKSTYELNSYISQGIALRGWEEQLNPHPRTKEA